MEHGRYRRQSVVRVRLFIEGGGNNRLNDLFRRAWTNFFKSAGLAGRQPAIVPGGSRNKTFDRFSSALREGRADDLPILLVDSEGSVTDGHSVWQHLQATDGWAQPPEVGGGRAFLMVQVMETWLLADRCTLRNYFGKSFRENHLPEWPDLEKISKDTVLQSLERATAGCNKRYAKGTVSVEVLGRINPGMVVRRCPHAKTILEYLRSL